MVLKSFGGKYNIGFGIPIEFPSQRKKYLNRPINKKLDSCGPVSHLKESTISDLESPPNFQVKEEKIVKSVHKQEIGLVWSSESFEVKYNIGFGIPSEFPSQRKILLKSVQKQRNYAYIKNAKNYFYHFCLL